MLVGAGLIQRIETKCDELVHFARYKRYAWTKNQLFMHQRLKDRAQIDNAVVDSMNRQPQAKRLVLDYRNSDFFIEGAA